MDKGTKGTGKRKSAWIDERRAWIPHPRIHIVKCKSIPKEYVLCAEKDSRQSRCTYGTHTYHRINYSIQMAGNNPLLQLLRRRSFAS